jgi:ABC-type transporter Mla subunit MlaD
MPTGTPLQPQPQYAQQPQFQQQQYAQQPQYYAPPMPDFSGILHSLAQHVNTLTQNSMATQQALTSLLQEHATLSNSIQHLNISNQQMQQALQRAPAVTGGNASFTTKVHTMEKPEKFDGTRDDSARTFLVRFALWAQSLGAQMNRLDAAGNRVGPRHDLWVQSALGYMTGEAAVWAEPYMTQMLSGQTPFLNTATQ